MIEVTLGNNEEVESYSHNPLILTICPDCGNRAIPVIDSEWSHISIGKDGCHYWKCYQCDYSTDWTSGISTIKTKEKRRWTKQHNLERADRIDLETLFRFFVKNPDLAESDKRIISGICRKTRSF